MDDIASNEAHFRNSTLRERILEHLFIGELLRRLWQMNVTDVQVLRSEYDAGGFDLVFTRGDVARYVQLKSSVEKKKSNPKPVNRLLFSTRGGCLIWLVVDDDLNIKSYQWMDAVAGVQAGIVDKLRHAKRPTANAKGIKPIKYGHILLPINKCLKLNSIDEVISKLFGDSLSPTRTTTQT